MVTIIRRPSVSTLLYSPMAFVPSVLLERLPGLWPGNAGARGSDDTGHIPYGMRSSGGIAQSPPHKGTKCLLREQLPRGNNGLTKEHPSYVPGWYVLSCL